jgi:hypothetical protein
MDYKKAMYAYFERKWNEYRSMVDHWLLATTAEYSEDFIREMLKDAQQKAYFYAYVLDILMREEDE